MAVSKAKRSIHPVQPSRPRFNPEPEPMPVKAHAYHTIAEMNTGLEQAIQGLQALLKTNSFFSDDLNAIHNQLSRIRAQANRRLIAAISRRETANVGHFKQLCLHSKPATR